MGSEIATMNYKLTKYLDGAQDESHLRRTQEPAGGRSGKSRSVSRRLPTGSAAIPSASRGMSTDILHAVHSTDTNCFKAVRKYVLNGNNA